MNHVERIEARAAALSELVAEKFGPAGPDLRRQARRLGRRVPRQVRADLALVGEAAALARHPTLSRRVPPEALDAAAARATAHLADVDPADRRRGALLHWLGDNAVNLLILGTLFVAALVWRGFV